MDYITILVAKLTILIVKWLIQTIIFTIQAIQTLNIIFVSALRGSSGGPTGTVLASALFTIVKYVTI